VEKKLPSTVIYNCDNSIVGIRITLKNSSICNVNAYLPFCHASNRDAYLEYLGALKIMCEELSCPNICVFGDFNADKNNAFRQLLDTFVIKMDTYSQTDYCYQMTLLSLL